MPSRRRPAMNSFVLTLCAVVALLVGVDTFVGAAPILETRVQRGIMFDRVARGAKTTNHGSRAVFLRGALKLLDLSNETAFTKSAYRHHSVYVPCTTHLTQPVLDALVTAPVKGLLLEQCEHHMSNDELLALYFERMSFAFPVYFLSSGNETAVLQQALMQQINSPYTSRVYVSIGKSESTTKMTANSSAKFYSVYSTLSYKPPLASTSGSNTPSTSADPAIAKRRGASNERASSVPRVLLTANYDTMGVAPAATTAAGASGYAAAMEVWRRLVSTAAKMSTPPPKDTSADDAVRSNNAMTALPFSVSMLLGSSARVNYAATTAWLSVQNEADLDKFKVTVSLDELMPTASSMHQQQKKQHANDRATSLSTVPLLYMHVSESFMRSEEGSALIFMAQFAAKATNVPLKVVPSKTNFHHYDLRFEHEVFVNRQMPAVTFSTHRMHSCDQLFRGVSAPVTPEAVAILAQRVDFVHTYIRLLLGMLSPPGASEHVPLTPSNSGDIQSAANCAHNTHTDTDAETDGNEKNGSTSAEMIREEWPGAESYLVGLLRSAASNPRSCMSQDGNALRKYAGVIDQSLSQLNHAARVAGSRSALASATRAMKLELSGIRLYYPYEETMLVYTAKSVWFDLMLLACTGAALLLFAISEFGSARLIMSLKKLA